MRRAGVGSTLLCSIKQKQPAKRTLRVLLRATAPFEVSEHLAILVHCREAVVAVADDDLEAAHLAVGEEFHAREGDFPAVVDRVADMLAADATIEKQQTGFVGADEDVVDRFDLVVLQVLGDEHFNVGRDALTGLDENPKLFDCLDRTFDCGFHPEHVEVTWSFETDVFGTDDVRRCHGNDLSVVGNCPVVLRNIINC